MTRIHYENITNCEFAVASSFQLPFIDKFADLIVCTFAPVSNDEYARVLKDGGKLVVVSPSPRHLFELKEVRGLTKTSPMYTDLINLTSQRR